MRHTSDNILMARDSRILTVGRMESRTSSSRSPRKERRAKIRRRCKKNRGSGWSGLPYHTFRSFTHFRSQRVRAFCCTRISPSPWLGFCPFCLGSAAGNGTPPFPHLRQGSRMAALTRGGGERGRFMVAKAFTILRASRHDLSMVGGI